MTRVACAACLAICLATMGVTASAGAAGTNSCTFTTEGTTMRLDADCWTDASIVIPDGFTLDGQGHTITALDPPGGFEGAVVQNGGATASVRHVTVTVQGLMNVCKAGAERLRGIMLEGASGAIEHTRVIGINKGASGCQEGNAIEIRNEPFDGTHPDTQLVSVAHNVIADDIGIGDYGSGNAVTKNKVWGFQTPFDGVTGGKNKSKDRPKPASVH